MVSAETLKRQLTAVLSADVAGYSRLISGNENLLIAGKISLRENNE